MGSVHRCTVSGRTTSQLTLVRFVDEDIEPLNAALEAAGMTYRLFPDRVGVHSVCDELMEVARTVIGDRPLL